MSNNCTKHGCSTQAFNFYTMLRQPQIMQFLLFLSVSCFLCLSLLSKPIYFSFSLPPCLPPFPAFWNSWHHLLLFCCFPVIQYLFPFSSDTLLKISCHHHITVTKFAASQSLTSFAISSLSTPFCFRTFFKDVYSSLAIKIEQCYRLVLCLLFGLFYVWSLVTLFMLFL